MAELKVIPMLGAAVWPDVVLQEATGKFESVVLIGYSHDGELVYRASFNLDRKAILWLLESFKRDHLMASEG